MPLIENYDPAKVVTPLQPLFPDLATSFLRLSPESQAEAVRVMQARSIRFVLDATTNDFVFSARAMHDGISAFYQRFDVGLRAMERAWAATFGYYIIFSWAADGHNARRQGLGLVPQPATLPEGVELLRWALSSRHSVEDYPWPAGLPSPSSPHADQKLMATVNAASVRVIGWILLHELGHFDLGLRWPPKVGQEGSLNPNPSQNDPYVQETSSA